MSKIVELKDFYQYVVKVDGSCRLIARNRNFLNKINSSGCKSLGSIPCLRKANTPLQKFVLSGNDEIQMKILMSCAPRKEYVIKLELTMVRIATLNQLPSFHLKT